MAEPRVNPYNPGNPVKPVHFAGRMAEIEEFRDKLAAVKKGFPGSIFVQGEWGIGKTSLLRKMHPEFSEHGVVIREDVPEGSATTQIRALYPAIFLDLKAETGIEIGLEDTRFRSEFVDLPKAESTTLMFGSLHGVEFPRSAVQYCYRDEGHADV